MLIGAAIINHRTNSSGEGIKKEASGLDSLEDFYRAGQDLRQNQNKPEVTFLAVGDMMFSRTVADKIPNHQNDAGYPFVPLSELLLSTDFNFGNLESPISGNKLNAQPGELTFNAPELITGALKRYNFTVLGIANNHILDQGAEGLNHTVATLHEAGIQTVGAGKTTAQAWQSAIVEKQGVKIGFLAASYAAFNDGGVATSELVARTQHLEHLKSSVSALKAQADLVVVAMHDGVEYTRTPNSAQQKFARAAIDAGADLVIGSHPHWIQTLEQYQGKYIFYSLGNFIFDQEWSRETKEGLALKITVKKDGVQSLIQGNRTPATVKQIELIPVIIEDYSTPRLASPEETAKILQKINVQNTILY